MAQSTPVNQSDGGPRPDGEYLFGRWGRMPGWFVGDRLVGDQSLGKTTAMTAAWTRVRNVVILAALLFGTVGPALKLSPATKLWVFALAGVVVVGWLLAWGAGETGPRATAAIVVYGTAGAVLAAVQPNGSALAFPAIACLNAGIHWSRQRSLVFAGAMSVTYLVTRAPQLHGRSAWWELLGPAVLVVCALAGGVRAQNARLAAQAERERSRAAALDERARIAREIHDILAHALAALSVQLETADALLDGGRVGQAQESVRRAGQLAREGLTETRRAIGALRGDSVPLPELIGELVASYRSNVDTDVAVTVTGEPRPLEPDVVLALYRTAQEALTNAQKHSPGAPVEVELRYAPGEVGLIVANSAPPAGAAHPLAGSGGGYGLAGLRERAELAGGSLAAGPVGDGYRVGVTIPA